MTETDDLLIALWGMFDTEISTGEPVFFCFSQETLRDRLSEALLGGRSPLDFICTAARTCYDIYDHDVLLRPGVLKPGRNGFSMAIVLVCQQVLAVEEMVNDGRRYSENAYFPRLRSLISPRLAQLSQNPFSFHDFESIWRTFAGEIQSISGSTTDTITFEFDSYSGINKARLFPLSQALLSRADLSQLVAQCRLERLRKGSVRDVWIEVHRERAHLSRRGQRLVNSGFLRERLVEQVQNYARRISVTGQTSPQPTERVQLELAICLDVSDWVNEEYAAFLIEKGTGQRVDDERRIRTAITMVVAERGYAFCALGEFGDYWSFSESTREVGPGETVLLLGIAMGIERGRAILDGLSPAVRVDDGRIRTLGAVSNVRVCPVTLPLGLDGTVTIRGGRIASDVLHTLGAANYDWLGGVCLDRRARKYLREALPVGIRFHQREFRIDDVNRVGDSPMVWDAFRSAIHKLETDASYELRFGTSYVARLSIAVVERGIARDAMGFLVDSHGLLSPTLERIGENDAGVVGFFQQGTEFARPASVRVIAALLRNLRSGGGRRLATQEVREIVARVEVSAIPQNVKNAVMLLLRRKPELRDTVLVDLLSN